MEGATVKDGLPNDLGASDRGHEVTYYEHSRFLVGRVADFIAPGLTAGEAAVMVATPKHADLVEAELIARGIDVAAAERAGTFVSLDAVETLGKFMLNGRPDPYLFDTVLGTTIERARAAAAVPIVRAFGEMVAVLWAQGRPGAAIALEDLWNRLLGHHPFSLLCGYPIEQLDASDIEKVSALHTRADPAD
ncbi:MAG TPA: MEDS domain-containing protein [Candidatus Limnocylindria bacterium]|nr:MEDS domain-containing protein [Candidatus Limnocylindria bacterium]